MISVSQLGFHKVYYKVIHDEVGMEQVTFTFVEGEATLQTEEIFYIETSRHKNIFHTADKTYSIYRKMDEIEAVMEGMGFCRCHQSFLVNMRYIQKISRRCGARRHGPQPLLHLSLLSDHTLNGQL